MFERLDHIWKNRSKNTRYKKDSGFKYIFSIVATLSSFSFLIIWASFINVFPDMSQLLHFKTLTTFPLLLYGTFRTVPKLHFQVFQ